MNNEEIRDNTQATEAENISAEETDTMSEKLFTKEEVSKIVEGRLARERKKLMKELPKVDDTELTARANRLDCREFVIENGYPAELLDVISTDDVQVFKEKATALQELYSQKYSSYPSVMDGGDIGYKMLGESPDQEIAQAFSRDTKHTPKKPPRYNF